MRVESEIDKCNLVYDGESEMGREGEGGIILDGKSDPKRSTKVDVYSILLAQDSILCLELLS